MQSCQNPSTKPSKSNQVYCTITIAIYTHLQFTSRIPPRLAPKIPYLCSRRQDPEFHHPVGVGRAAVGVRIPLQGHL